MSEVVARREASTVAWATRILASLAHRSAASWALLVFSCGTALSAALQRLLLTSGLSSQRLVELDIGEIFATCAVISLVLTDPRDRPALTRIDLGILVVCCLTWFLPEPHAVYAGMSLAATWLVIRRTGDRLLREIGQVWLALSLCELWSKLVFKLFYHAIAPLEVGLIAWAGRFAYPGLQSSGVYLSTRPDWSLVMLEGCSAFHNLSLAALIWLCVLKIAGRRAGLPELKALAVSAGLVVTINIARILIMLPSPADYHFWHDETGSVVVALISVVASIIPIVIHIERTPCPAARTA